MIEITIDVRVVEFDAGENYVTRAVVEKFWPLIEKCRVVLVSFYDDVLAAAGTPAAAEVQRYAADEKARIESCARKNPCRHRGCRLLPVCPRSHQGASRADQKTA